MKLRLTFYCSLVITALTIISCKKKVDNSEFLLFSERVGQEEESYIMIYKDSTFAFWTTKFTNKKVYSGKAKITNDSIFLNYKDSIHQFGSKIVLKKEHIEFTEYYNVKFKNLSNSIK